MDRLARGLLLAITTFLVAGCSGVMGLVAARPAPGSDPRCAEGACRPGPCLGRVVVSWARGYQSIEDLVADADLVVDGHVVGIRDPGPGSTTPGAWQVAYQFDVSREIAGDAPGAAEDEAAATILVTHTVDVQDGRLCPIVDDALYELDARYVLALRRIDSSQPDQDRYTTLGGPQGRLGVDEDGRLFTIGRPHIQLPPGVTVDDLP